jgi:hypothetical protein
MPSRSWQETKQVVRDRAKACCEYCQTSEANTGQTMHIEHIQPNGADDLDNLCLSCANCNLSKAAAISAIDPISSETVPLFNPRIQLWAEHFQWTTDYKQLQGLTMVGRATIERLKMNQEKMQIARARWRIAGHHPPSL